MKKLLVIQVAALGHELLRENNALRRQGLEFRPAQSVFPALTCPVQASFRTASPPESHGMTANGVYSRELGRPMFWEQSSRLVAGPRIWDDFRARGGRVGLMFWQQSMGEAADLILTPAPIHKHHGGMIQDCYSQPPGLYARLCKQLGRPFKLQRYWGPLASAKVGDWIADATAAVLGDRELAPDLLLTYLPSLDYDLQRFGPHHEKASRALARTLAQLDVMVRAARREGYEVLVYGDYAIADASTAVFPNRALLAAGLMSVRNVRGRLYPDFHTSRAFAMVDHEIAHVYVRDSADLQAVRKCVAGCVAGILPACGEGVSPSSLQSLAVSSSVPQQQQKQQQDAGGTPATHEPVRAATYLVAADGHWFAYPWWTDKRQAPDYAAHVDIHNKPGYDPCELFFGWPPSSVSQDTSRILGSHGRVGPGREIAWASTLPIGQANTLLDLAATVRGLLTNE